MFDDFDILSFAPKTYLFMLYYVKYKEWKQMVF